MMRQVTGTVLSRAFVAVMNLLVTVIAGHALGGVGLGVISLVVLGITLVMLPANLIGGGALVYLVPRAPLPSLVRPSYLWALASAGISYVVLVALPLVPPGYALHVCLLAMMQAFYGIHLGVLLGQQRILQHNLISAVQAATLLVVFSVLVRLQPHPDAMAYVYASYAAFGSTLVLSALAVRWRQAPVAEAPRDHVRFLVRQGLWVQGANAMQLVNYRFAYELISKLLGHAQLGLYSVANQLAESAWLAPRSLGMVLLSRVSNTPGQDEQQRLTLLTMKAAVGCALAVVLALGVLPDGVFTWAFGKDISGLRPLFWALAPGILGMAASQAFSHFFSGTGRNRHNLVGSGLGMVVTLVAGLTLIPRSGLLGAAITASLAYLTSVAYQLAIFLRLTRCSLLDLLPGTHDLRRLRDLLAAARR